MLSWTGRFTAAAIPLAALIGMAVIVGLVVQKKSVLQDYRELAWQRSTPYPGAFLPEVQLTSLDGDTLLLGGPPQDSRQLLFYFTTTCPYCRASLPIWKRLHRELQDNVTVIGVSLSPKDSTASYVTTNDLAFPVVIMPDSAARLKVLFRTAQVPATVVVDHNGRVLYARVGVLDSDALADSIRESARTTPQGVAR